MIRLDPKAAAWRSVDGEVVGLALADSEYFTVNESATLLWDMLARGTTEQAMAAGLVERYGLDEAAAKADVRAFVAALKERGLLDA